MNKMIKQIKPIGTEFHDNINVSTINFLVGIVGNY